MYDDDVSKTDDHCGCLYCLYSSFAVTHSAWSAGCAACRGLVDDIIGLMTMTRNPHNCDARMGHDGDDDPGVDAYGPMTRAMYLNKCIPACPEGCLTLRDPALFAAQDRLVSALYDLPGEPWNLTLDEYVEIVTPTYLDLYELI